MLDLLHVWKSRPQPHEPEPLARVLTPWGAELDPACPLPEHPRPQLARAAWRLLNGPWDYAFLDGADWEHAASPAEPDGTIVVPFSPEAPLSGVHRQLLPSQTLWYRRAITCEKRDGMRLLLHFEAVDYACRVLVNGREATTHKGSYLPFYADITDLVTSGENTLEVFAHDPSDAGTQLRGKQSLSPGGIWYTAQSGIWGSVWLEEVPDAHVESISLAPTLSDVAVTCSVSECDGRLEAELLDGEVVVARTRAHASQYETTLTLAPPSPHLWTPDDPHLYQLRIRYGADEVSSYCALRTVGMRRDAQGHTRVCLNGHPIFLRGVLDQGYWPDSLMTAPSDAALEHDVLLARELGFNMIRKHIKIEAARWYWHCDRLGMLVWQDIPSGGGAYDSWATSFRPTLFRRSWHTHKDDAASWPALGSDDPTYQAEWRATCEDAICRLGTHPSVIGWTLFNEAWGQFDAAAAVDLARDIDPVRPISATSGWYDQAAGSVWSVHNYFRPLDVWPDPTGRNRAFAISEFGGLTWHVSGHSQVSRAYGYADFATLADWRRAVRRTLAEVDALEPRGLAGYVYTQLADVEEESNGLLTCDRRVNKLAE